MTLINQPVNIFKRRSFIWITWPYE